MDVAAGLLAAALVVGVASGVVAGRFGAAGVARLALGGFQSSCPTDSRPAMALRTNVCLETLSSPKSAIVAMSLSRRWRTTCRTHRSRR